MTADTHSLLMPTVLTRMGEAREWAVAHARRAGLDERAVSELELALTEALSNVIRHGYAGSQDGEIRLSLTVDDHRLTMTIEDRGRAFDRDAHAGIDLDLPQGGGYGVFLIEEVMDEAEWSSSPEGNCLRLVKYRERQGG